jgi:hypothetical protein
MEKTTTKLIIVGSTLPAATASTATAGTELQIHEGPRYSGAGGAAFAACATRLDPSMHGKSEGKSKRQEYCLLSCDFGKLFFISEKGLCLCFTCCNNNRGGYVSDCNF